MNRKTLGALLGLLSILFLFSFVALAQSPSPSPAPIVPDQDLSALFSQILAAFSSGKVALGVASIVLALTYVVRKLYVDTNKIGSGLLPWVSLGLGALFGVASNIVFGASPAHAAAAVLLSGPIASQIWSALLKLVVKKPA